jgi:hypothetical protein
MLCFGFMYSRFKRRIEQDDDLVEQRLISEYLLNGDETNDRRPVLWIHTSNERNARRWINFGSRSSTEPNQPYLDLTIQSIVNHCADSFKICLIDDNSFTRLLPEWDVHLARTPDPIKSRLRKIGISKLLHMFGGLVVPASFVCTGDLIGILDASDCDMVVSEMASDTLAGSRERVTHEITDTFIGGKRGAPIFGEYETYISYIISTDTSAKSDVEGTLNHWFSEKVSSSEVAMIPGQTIGTRDANGATIPLDDMMSEQHIHLHCTALGMYVPEKQLLSRTKYNWFCVLSYDELADTNVFIARLLGTAAVE